jgi:hypothetical protein
MDPTIALERREKQEFLLLTSLDTSAETERVFVSRTIRCLVYHAMYFVIDRDSSLSR